jgi:MarR family transcriptional regulator, transcriptional regulator for hemolysin
VLSGPQPIGLDLAQTGRVVSRAFDEELARAGGSLPTWLILLAIKRSDHTMQRDIADSIGIEGATLTHHLNRMERDGLVTRQRSPENRRNQTVALTHAGEAFFQRQLRSVVAFDRQLRTGLTDDQLDSLRGFLSHLRSNIGAATALLEPS